MALVPTTQQRVRANLDVLRDPGLRVPKAEPSGAAILGEAMLDLTAQLSDENDKTAASNAYAKAVKDYQDFSTTDGPLTKTPQDMFSGGATINDLHIEHRTRLDEIGTTAGSALTNKRQHGYFNSLWNKRKDSEAGSMAKHIAKSNKKYRDDGVKAFWETTDQKVGEMANAVEQDWRSWLGASGAMRKELAGAVTLGAPQSEIQEKLLTYRDIISGSVVRGWFKEQPDRYSAAESLFTGKISNPDVQAMYDSLGVKAKDTLYRRMIDDSSKLTTIANGDRARAKAVEKSDDEQMVKDFYGKEDLSEDAMHEMVGWARRSPHISEGQVAKMEAFARAGGREEALDNERDMANVERAIRDDEIKSDLQMYDYIADNNLQISNKTARSRYLPMIEQQSDQTFMDALRWGQSELGIISGSILGSAFKDPVDRASALEADLRKFRQDNPEADIWQRAEATTARLKKTANSASLAALPLVTSAYRNALASGDARKISSARQALIAVMQEGGLVDPLTASGENFDPLTIINQPRK